MKQENRAESRQRKASARKKTEFKNTLKTVGLIAAPCLLVAAIIGAAFWAKKAYSLTVDYSAGLAWDGKIEGVNAGDYVQVCDYANIEIPEAEVVKSEEEIDEYISKILTENKANELTDEFVAENFSEYATTVDEYREYVKNMDKEENIKSYIIDYLLDNSKLTSYPKKYFNLVKKNMDRQYKIQYQYNNNMYYQILGSYAWSSHLDYYGVSRSEYKAMVESGTEKSVKQNLVLQYIYEELGLDITNEDINASILESGYTADQLQEALDNSGMPYWRQYTANSKVISTLAEQAVVVPSRAE